MKMDMVHNWCNSGCLTKFANLLYADIKLTCLNLTESWFKEFVGDKFERSLQKISTVTWHHIACTAGSNFFLEEEKQKQVVLTIF